MNDGGWTRHPNREIDHGPPAQSQPPGCLLYSYNASEIARCNEDGKILFVGDSVVRQVFWASARKIEGERGWVFEQRAKPDTHGDLEFEVDGARLKFLWDPWLNGSALHEELRAFRRQRERSGQGKNYAVQTEEEMGANRSVVMLVGGGLSHARHHDTNAVELFKHSVDSIISTAYGDSSPANIRTAPTTSDDGVGVEIFFSPVIEPIYDMLSPAREVMITPNKIDAMNRYLGEQSSKMSLNVIWSYTNMTNGQPERYQESGLHVVESVANDMADVFLNLRCNAKAAKREGFPYNRTCCSAYRPMDIVQSAGIIITLLLLIWMVVKNADVRPTSNVFSRCWHLGLGCKDGKAHPKGCQCLLSRNTAACARQTRDSFYSSPRAHSRRFSTAVFTLFLIACYCLITDRTQVFEKKQKQFSKLEFGSMLGVVVVVCLLNIKAVPPSHHQRNGLCMSANSATTSFLPRVQSDEYKGWMQVFVLVYNYTGGKQELELYELHRIVIALYLFLSGYGHAMYFLQSGDVTLRRITTVLLRINLLAILLSSMMGRPFASYHFAPLVSFWTLVVYFTLNPTPRYNDSLHLCGRMAVSALLVTSFVHIPRILDWSFLVLSYTLRVDLDVGVWRYYLGIDTYVVYIGMLTALLHIRIRSILRIPLARLTGVPRFIRKYSGTFQALAVGLAFTILPGFWILTRRSPDKADYDWWMPYIAWMPVLSLIVVRNATRSLRSHYCVPFAWLGRMSLELYLLSQHMWMAGDGYGRLTVGIKGGGWWDLLVLSLILVEAAWSGRGAAAVITAWVMGMDADADEDMELEARKGHGRGGDDVAPTEFLGGHNVTVELGESRNGGLPSVVKRRLVVILVVVWMGSVLSRRGHVVPLTQ